MVKLKKILFVSFSGLRKEAIASVRIYNLIKELSRYNNIDVFFPNLKESGNDLYSYDFINGMYLYDINQSIFIHKFRKNYKEFSYLHIQKNNNNKFLELINAFIVNNIFFYNFVYSQKNQRYYKITYKNYYLKKIDIKNYDVVFTSSNPSIMNYFGYKIKKKNPNIFWVADYRDLNQNNPYKSDKFNFRGKKMDKLAFKHADLITTVSQGAKEQNIENAKNMGFDIRNKSYVLYNGYSKQEINNIENSDFLKKYEDILSSDKVVIVFTGTIYPLRRIDLFLEALKKADNVLFVYAGNSYDLIDHYSKEFKIESKVVNLGFIPKEEAEFLQKKSDVLLQLKADVKEEGILTGKFYEYLQKNKRILSLGDKDEEYNEICKNLKNVDILPYVTEKIVEYLNRLKKEDLKETYDPNIERFSWENLAKEFDDFITEKLKERKSLI